MEIGLWETRPVRTWATEGHQIMLFYVTWNRNARSRPTPCCGNPVDAIVSRCAGRTSPFRFGHGFECALNASEHVRATRAQGRCQIHDRAERWALLATFELTDIVRTSVRKGGPGDQSHYPNGRRWAESAATWAATISSGATSGRSSRRSTWAGWTSKCSRTQGSLGHNEKIDPKVAADQRGHGIGVAIDTYTEAAAWTQW